MDWSSDVCSSDLAATGRARLPWLNCVERPEDLAKAVPSNAAHPELPPTSGRKVPLPTYTFEAARYWIDTAAASPASGTPADDRAEPDHSLPGHPLLGRRVALPMTSELRWSTEERRVGKEGGSTCRSRWSTLPEITQHKRD